MDKIIEIYLITIIVHIAILFLTLVCTVKPSFFNFKNFYELLPSNRYFYLLLFLDSIWLGGMTYIVRIFNGFILGDSFSS